MVGAVKTAECNRYSKLRIYLELSILYMQLQVIFQVDMDILQRTAVFKAEEHPSIPSIPCLPSTFPQSTLNRHSGK